MTAATLDAIQAYLRRDPLRHVVLEKLLRAYAPVADLRYAEVERQPAALILIPQAASPWDSIHYPEIDTIALLAADHARAADQLLAGLPAARYVFKIAGMLAQEAVLRRLPARRTTAFISYTADQQTRAVLHPHVLVTSEPGAALLALFAEQGHAPADLWQACQAGIGLVLSVTADGMVVACCFVQAIGGQIWEIGGLFTQPSYRRRGLASALVETALHVLAQRDVLARYQVHEQNLASRQLAEAIGLRQFVIVEHWVGAVRSGH